MILSGNLKLTDYEEINYIYIGSRSLGVSFLVRKVRGGEYTAGDSEGQQDLLGSLRRRGSDQDNGRRSCRRLMEKHHVAT